MQLVSEIMTRHVKVISPQDSIMHAVRMMDELKSGWQERGFSAQQASLGIEISSVADLSGLVEVTAIWSTRIPDTARRYEEHMP